MDPVGGCDSVVALRSRETDGFYSVARGGTADREVLACAFDVPVLRMAMFELNMAIVAFELGMRTFGMSAPLAILQREFEFTTEHVVALARAQVSKASSI